MSAETSFTPGPWKSVKRSNGYVDDDNNPVVIESEDWVVAVAIGDVYDLDAQANAHLIAAAPELYEQLKKAIGWLDSQEPFDIREAESALAKARGEA